MTDALQAARELVTGGLFESALRKIARVVSEDAAVLAFQAGAIALKKNDAFAAVTAFERVAALDADFPVLNEALASAYRRDARYEDSLAVPGTTRQVRYEHGMSNLALGRAEAALACFDTILTEGGDHAASWFASHAAALERDGMEEALRRLRRAVACPGANGKYWGFLGAYGLLNGDAVAEELIAREVLPHPPRRALVDGILAIRPYLGQARVFGLSASVLRFAVAQAQQSGLVLEFGVRRGTSLNVIAACAGQQVHGFDSFEGLPEGWHNEPAGVLTTGNHLPKVAANAALYPGWFDDTLAPFLAGHPGPVRLVNIDSDIYASARTVLEALIPRIVPGSVLVFDEFIGNRNWAEDEYRAFQEYVAATGVSWRVLAVAPFTKQVAIVIEA